MSIIYHQGEIANWYALILNAQSQANVLLDQEVEVYLAFMMKRSIKDVSMAGVVVALKYFEALQQPQARSIRLLKTTAEYSLILSTLFPKLASRRNVSDSYYADMSQVAYSDLVIAYENQVPSLGELYKKILGSFKEIMAVMFAFRCSNKNLYKSNVETRYPRLGIFI